MSAIDAINLSQNPDIEPVEPHGPGRIKKALTSDDARHFYISLAAIGAFFSAAEIIAAAQLAVYAAKGIVSVPSEPGTRLLPYRPALPSEIEAIQAREREKAKMKEVLAAQKAQRAADKKAAKLGKGKKEAAEEEAA